MWVRFSLCFLYTLSTAFPARSLPSPLSVLTISWRSQLRCLLPRQRNKQKSSNVENAKTNTVGENTTKQTFAAQVPGARVPTRRWGAVKSEKRPSKNRSKG